MYVTGLGTTLNSHFKFTGQATITPGWYAGYVIQVEVVSKNPPVRYFNQAPADRS